mgnify:CR=1 FL=1|jgi:hypothetical protein
MELRMETRMSMIISITMGMKTKRNRDMLGAECGDKSGKSFLPMETLLSFSF